MTEDINKEQDNSKFSLWLPIILGVVLAAGILIGKSLNSSESITKYILQSDPNKLDFIVDVINKEYVDSVNAKDLIEKALPEVLSNLDPHTVYIPAKDLKRVDEPLKGNFDGIGIQFNILNDTLLIVNTISGGPAEKVGVMAGDKIITINDSLFSGTGISNEDVVKQLKGKKGSTVKIGVKRQSAKDLLNFDITRDKIPLYSVDVSYMINENLGYIKISSFGENTHNEFVEALEKLQNKGMKKLILDLRSNGGGYLNAATSISDEFLKNDQLIVYTQGKSRPRKDYKATSKGLFEDGELAVLIDSWSASASEIVAGAVQDHSRGKIFGRRSFGKGLVQETSFFRDGSAMRLTTARYYTPAGRCIQKPYDKGLQKYGLELYERFKNGELLSADSAHFDKDKAFKTKSGKTVYGGGGIMPDVFVPIDTLLQSAFFRVVANKLYNYSLEYTNSHRSELTEFKTADEITNFLDSKGVYSNFMKSVNKSGIKPAAAEKKAAEKLVRAYLYAYICRNILDNDGYFKVIQTVDKTLLEAINDMNE